MKSLALFITACILFLSAFGGMVEPVLKPAAKGDCCLRLAGMKGNACAKQTGKQSKGCDKQGCSMLFSCSICGFLIVEPVVLQSRFARYQSKPIALYKIGDLSAYHPSDWKPPKNC